MKRQKVEEDINGQKIIRKRKANNNGSPTTAATTEYTIKHYSHLSTEHSTEHSTECSRKPTNPTILSNSIPPTPFNSSASSITSSPRGTPGQSGEGQRGQEEEEGSRIRCDEPDYDSTATEFNRSNTTLHSDILSSSSSQWKGTTTLPTATTIKRGSTEYKIVYHWKNAIGEIFSLSQKPAVHYW
jgi:hypothetical protein